MSCSNTKPVSTMKSVYWQIWNLQQRSARQHGGMLRHHRMQQAHLACWVCACLCVCVRVCVCVSAYGVYMDMYLHFGETFIGEKLRLLKEKLAQTVAKQKMTTASSSSVPPNLG